MAETYTFNPLQPSTRLFSTTQSVGIYPLVPRASGDGTRPGVVVKRFYGDSSNWQKINAAASAWCAATNRLDEWEQAAVLKRGTKKEKV